MCPRPNGDQKASSFVCKNKERLCTLVQGLGMLVGIQLWEVVELATCFGNELAVGNRKTDMLELIFQDIQKLHHSNEKFKVSLQEFCQHVLFFFSFVGLFEFPRVTHQG